MKDIISLHELRVLFLFHALSFLIAILFYSSRNGKH